MLPHNGPPICTPWCSVHPEGPQWEECPSGFTVTCRRVIQCEESGDGNPVTITLERFARYGEGRLLVDPVTVQVYATGDITPEDAKRLGYTLIRAAELAHEPIAVPA